MANTIRIKRERKQQLAQYATAAVTLYGVISLDEFVEVFNYYEDNQTTAEEALLALTRLAKTDDVEYSVSGNLLSGPAYQPEFDDYKENVEAIRAAQQGKPRYLPRKEEFLKYVNPLYYEPEGPYAGLRSFILTHRLTTRGLGFDGVDGDLIDLREIIQLGGTPAEELEYFNDSGYHFQDQNELNLFYQCVVNVHNHTRMYENNGFTPNEMAEQLQRPKPAHTKPEPLRPETVPKVGRNDPCPCGSGRKYKRCHGR